MQDDTIKKLIAQIQTATEARLQALKFDVPNRYELERKLQEAIGKVHDSELADLMHYLGDPPRVENVPLDFWEKLGRDLRGAIAPVLQSVFLEQAHIVVGVFSIGAEWGLVNQAAVDWASAYSFELVRGINATTQAGLQTAISTYYRDSMTLGGLQEMVGGYFGPVRAEMIAITEITRASVEGELAIIKEIERDNSSIEMVAVWQTSNDDRVCPICRPLNRRKAAGKEDNKPYWIHPTSGAKVYAPPAHPRCRCWITHDMTVRNG